MQKRERAGSQSGNWRPRKLQGRAGNRFGPGPPGVGCLTLDRNGNWLCKFERKPRLRGNRDVLLSGSGGTCRASTSTHCTPDQRSLAATGEGADQRTRGGASADVLNVALVVVGASPADLTG